MPTAKSLILQDTERSRVEPGPGKTCRAADARLAAAAAAARSCVHCRGWLALGPRPAFQLSARARVLIVGQAPGTRVHASGRPFTDPSGDRLRDWLGVDKSAFYDPHRFAILPAGLCYPGRNPKGGDLPPAKDCGPLWHPRLRPLLVGVRLTVLVGQYGHRLYLGDRAAKTVAATVGGWRDLPASLAPTPHPSWRVNGWLKRNPWFEAELLPDLRRRVASALAS